MKPILLIFAILLGWSSMVRAADDKRFVTDCELSDFVKTPRYAETVAYAQRLAEASPMVHYTTFGVSPEGRELPLLIVDKEGLVSPEEIRANGRMILLVEACIHSGEPDGKDAGYMWIRDMVIRKQGIEVLDKVSVLFIPIFNVDGHENFGARNRINQNGPEELGTRVTGQLLNLNRDFLKADAPEMRAWLALYNRWMPELFVDVHVTNGADFQYVMTYGLESHTSFLEEGLRRWTEQRFEQQLNERMAAVGFPIFPYFEFRNYNEPESGILIDVFDPRYSNGYTSVRNRIGLLLENHIYKPYKQRVLATIEMLKACAQILGEEQQTLTALIRQADARVASAAFRQEPLAFEFVPASRDSVMVDFLSWERDTTISDLSGAPWVTHNYEKPKTVRTSLITSFDSTISVRLPEAYILMPQWDKVRELLDLHGVRYTRLNGGERISVETYRYTGATFATRQSEGRIPVKAAYTTQTEELLLPPGALLIDMNQPAAKVVAWMLEPAAPGSLTYWGFFNQVVQAPGEFWVSLPYMEVKGRELLQKDPALKAEFEAKKASDPAFSQNSEAILRFFYDRVKKASEQNAEIHPAWRVMNRTELEKVKNAD